MSWSVSFIGKPENVAAALEAEKAKLKDQCLEEYEAVLPHLLGLVGQNFRKPGSNYSEPMIKLEASGTGMKEGTPAEVTQRSCSVKIEPFYAKLV